MRKLICIALSTFIAGSAMANEPPRKDPAEKAIAASVPGAKIVSIEPGPLRGWKTVTYNDTSIAYVIDGGSHIVFGNVIRVSDRHSYTLEKLGVLRKKMIAELPESLRLTFRAQNQKAEIIVFTDVSCSFCGIFHRNNLPAYTAAGVTVHYYPSPRGGRASPAYQVMRDIWCSPDPKAALTAYFSDPTRHPPAAGATCNFDTAVIERTTEALGMRGTPGVFTMSGEDLGGAAPIQEGLRRLGLD